MIIKIQILPTFLCIIAVHSYNDMIHIQAFTFNYFQENTYILYDSTKECIIIDPGCCNNEERKELTDFIENNSLKPVKLMNTHCHVDHVLGNRFIFDKYQLSPIIHKKDLIVLHSLLQVAAMYGFNAEESPEPQAFLEEGDIVTFGESSLELFFTPGHSPGSISFYHRAQKFIIVGDVLFYGSIGRTDLPGGHHDTLINSIKTKLFSLEDDFKVYSGHGSTTTIGFERKSNPFLI